MAELHHKLRPARRHGTQSVDIAKHIGQRYQRLNDGIGRQSLRPLNLTPAGVQITDDVTHIIFWRCHLYRHHGLQQLWASGWDCFTEAGAGRNLKRANGGVNVVRLSINQRDLPVNQREASDRAVIR